MYMYPMTFDEFLLANGQAMLKSARDNASVESPLPLPLHEKLVQLLRTYMIVGGMPEVVAKWASTHDYLQCQEVQDDIIVGYESDFPKYRKRINPVLLKATLTSVALQATKKFVYSAVGDNYKTAEVKGAIDLLAKAGLVIPVTHSDANGVPLGSETDVSIRKMLLLDTGLMLRLLNMSLGNITTMTTHILTASATDLVNKGTMAEMLAGIEILRRLSPNIRHDLYYWVRKSKNALAEIDYIGVRDMAVLPIEVKAGTQGGMKSLWAFMRDKGLSAAVRCSLENFGEFDYIDEQANGAKRNVKICPLYALSMLPLL